MNLSSEEFASVLIIAIIVGVLFGFMSTDYGGSQAANGIIAGTIALVVSYGALVLLN